MSKIRIGTSGWAYKHWCPKFYPGEIKADKFLKFYANEFNTAEINYSFYKLPSQENYVDWANQVSDDFIFAVKGSRYLTHLKKLKDPVDPWKRICDTAGCLGNKLGPILLQFPAQWHKNIARLEEFLQCTRDEKTHSELEIRLAFEFRDETWFCRDVYRLLEKYEVALCIADSLKFVREDTVTTDFTYIRYHGRTPIYAANYTAQQLRSESKKIEKFASDGIDVYAYFNNDGGAHAIQNARKLKELLSLT